MGTRQLMSPTVHRRLSLLSHVGWWISHMTVLWTLLKLPNDLGKAESWAVNTAIGILTLVVAAFYSMRFSDPGYLPSRSKTQSLGLATEALDSNQEPLNRLASDVEACTGAGRSSCKKCGAVRTRLSKHCIYCDRYAQHARLTGVIRATDLLPTLMQ